MKVGKDKNKAIAWYHKWAPQYSSRQVEDLIHLIEIDSVKPTSLRVLEPMADVVENPLQDLKEKSDKGFAL